MQVYICVRMCVRKHTQLCVYSVVEGVTLVRARSGDGEDTVAYILNGGSSGTGKGL